MKIAIISDSHDNIPNIDKMLDYVKKNNIEVILHCGDVCAPSVLKYLAEKFKSKIYLVYGNVDGDREKMEELSFKYDNLNILGEKGEVEMDGKKIGLVHYPDIAKQMAESVKFDLVFYGHSHKPWEEKVGQTRLVNPGTLGGLFQRATFAVYNTDDNNLQLIVLDQI